MLQISSRDRELLQLLDRTPATTPLVRKASLAFAAGPFHDERRARERLQRLAAENLVRAWPLGQPGGGAVKYYKLSPQGYAALHGDSAPLPPRAFFGELAPSRVEHTLVLAEAIVHTLVSAHQRHIQVTKFHRENELTLEVGLFVQQPDCHIQLHCGGKTFNVLFEIDRSTESVDSHVQQSIRQKILGYEAYQDMVSSQWKAAGEQGPRPYFKVAFLTRSVERAYHLLSLARQLARNPDRRLVYAATHDSYLAEPEAARAPLFLDHTGCWRAMVELHPTSPALRTPVRLPKFVEAPAAIW